MKLFKVVHRTGNGLASCFMGQPALEEIYVPGQWSVSRVGGLFAFDNARSATSFIKRYCPKTAQYYEIWKAECDEADILPTPPCSTGVAIPPARIERFWKCWLLDHVASGAVETWPGTVIAKKLRLVRRMDMSEIGQTHTERKSQ